MKNKLLIIDDEEKILKSLTFLLEDTYEVFTALNSIEAYKIFTREDISLVLLDLSLGEDSGFELMNKMLKYNNEAVIIIMTAYSSIENSIEAIKSGAYYFVPKPIDLDQLIILLNEANKSLMMKEKIKHLEGYVKKDFIGRSDSILRITSIIDKVKDTNATILITGETGTGKELISQKIHRTSNRVNQPFVSINCSAIPKELLESELFGYKKGAFTGATSDEIGIIRKADKGTLLLDEMGEMDLNLQAKLLRFLQERKVRPIGSSETYDVDVRIICVTNRNLKERVSQDLFREDLYYRINVINIETPPLRDRLEDLDYFIDYFINMYNISFNRSVKGLSQPAYDYLKNYDFPGNVRELENIIQRGVLLTNKEYIGLEDLANNQAFSNMNNRDNNYLIIYPGETLKEVEKKLIEFELKNNEGNKNLTAKKLGISERGIRYKIDEYKL